MVDIEKIKNALKTNMKPVVVNELPNNAMCIPLTKSALEFVEISFSIMNELVKSYDSEND